MPRPVITRTMLDGLAETPWAILPSALTRIVESVARGDPRAAAEAAVPSASRAGSISVIPVHGVIEHRADWWAEIMGGGTSIETVRGLLAAELADPAVRAVVLDIDSPGGTVAGITEFAAQIRASRGGDKPIVAIANGTAASAAYWLGAQADEFVASPSAQVGSIGVYAVHQEASRMLDEMGVTTTVVSAGPHKTEGNEFEPLSDAARSAIQSRVDASYAVFLDDVAKGRGVTAERVEAEYGGGQVLTAQAALAVGMVDRVEALDQTLRRLGRSSVPRRRMAAEAGLPDITAMPFGERVAAIAEEIGDVVAAAEHRARSRAAEGRPAFSADTENALRASRDAIDALLPGEPAPSAVLPGEPAKPTPPPAASPPRFANREAWLRYLETQR